MAELRPGISSPVTSFAAVTRSLWEAKVAAGTNQTVDSEEPGGSCAFSYCNRRA